MAKKSTALAVVEAPRETLHQIETELRELCDLRDSLDPSEAEAIQATDEQIEAFVGREIRKVTGIAALLRYFRSQTEAAKAEEAHARKWRDRWEARYNRLATMVHGVMVAMDVQKLEGATDRFRRQNNPEATEVYDAAALPDEYLKGTIKLPYADVKWLLAAARNSSLDTSNLVITSDVDAVKLKAALQANVDCHYCQGIGEIPTGGEVNPCQNCEGTGQVRATIPGARLTRGEHLRVE